MTRGGNTGRADRKRCRIMLASKLRFLPGCPSLSRETLRLCHGHICRASARSRPPAQVDGAAVPSASRRSRASA